MAEMIADMATESRLESLREILKINDDARSHIHNVYSECKIPLWTRAASGVSSFIEETDWLTDHDETRSKTIWKEFLEKAFDNATGDPLQNLVQHEELRIMEEYYVNAVDFMKGMRKCVEAEMAIIGGQSLELKDPGEVLQASWESLKITFENHLSQSESQGQMTRQKKRKVEPGNLSEAVSDAVKKIVTAGGWVVEDLKGSVDACFVALDDWRKEKNNIKYKKIEGVDSKLMHLDLIQQRFVETQKKCKSACEIISNTMRLVQGFITQKTISNLPEEMAALEDIGALMQQCQIKLEEGSIVIEEQPDQIIEIKKHDTKTKESLKIKLRSMLNVRVDDVTLKLVNKDDHDSNRTSKAGVSHKTVRNGDRTILSEIKITNFSRPINQNVLFVPYAFQLEIKMADKKIQIYSCECILGSHTQLSKAQGYLLWSWAFSTNEPFEVREEVPWSEVHPVLKDYFYKETEYRFTQDNINCLGEMFESDLISWKNLVVNPSRFCKKQEQKEKNFTLWDWLCGAKNVLKDFPGLCREKLIHGFITKNRADELLKEEQEGSFLLRFSHTFLDSKTTPVGGLSVVVNTYNHKKCKNEVLHSAPFSLKSERADRLPKEGTFGLWLTQFVTKSNENTEVTLKMLCGVCQDLEQTFRNYMMQTPGRAWRDYTPVSQKWVMGNVSDINPVNVEVEQETLLQDKIREIMKIAKVQHGHNIILEAPTAANRNWIMHYETGYRPSPAMTSEYSDAASPSTTNILSPSASDYQSASEEQTDGEEMMDTMQQESTNELVEDLSTLSFFTQNGDIEDPIVTIANTDVMKDYFGENSAASALYSDHLVPIPLPQMGEAFAQSDPGSLLGFLESSSIPETVKNIQY